jgi:hypothetical protein
LVTGISTGALTAPFAFLGSAWDAKLKSVYTDITLPDVLVQRGFTAALWNDGMADNKPLLRTISRYFDEAMMAEIARAYEGGRLLLIGTSNLDAQMPVIWNIGAIARSGHPKGSRHDAAHPAGIGRDPRRFLPRAVRRHARRPALTGAPRRRWRFRAGLPLSAQRIPLSPGPARARAAGGPGQSLGGQAENDADDEGDMIGDQGGLHLRSPSRKAGGLCWDISRARQPM